MDIYFNTKEFLNDQIRLLNSQFQRDDIDEVIDLDHEEDELSDQIVTKLLARVNQRKRAYYSRIFTQQAIKHVVMQVQKATNERSLQARKELEDERNEIFVSTDPGIAQLTERRINTLQVGELVKLAETLVLAHKSESTQKLNQSLENHRAAVERHKLQAQLATQITDTFTTSPQEHVQKNLVTSQSPILDELARLRMLCVKLQAKAFRGELVNRV